MLVNVKRGVQVADLLLDSHKRSDLDVLGGRASGGLLVSLGLLLAGRNRVVIDMSAGAVSSQMSVVDSWVKRDRSR